MLLYRRALKPTKQASHRIALHSSAPPSFNTYSRRVCQDRSTLHRAVLPAQWPSPSSCLLLALPNTQSGFFKTVLPETWSTTPCSQKELDGSQSLIEKAALTHIAILSARAAQKLDLEGRRTSVPSAALIGLKKKTLLPRHWSPCPITPSGVACRPTTRVKKRYVGTNRCDRCTPPLPLASSRIRSTRRSASILLRARCRPPPHTTYHRPPSSRLSTREPRTCVLFLHIHTSRSPTNPCSHHHPPPPIYILPFSLGICRFHSTANGSVTKSPRSSVCDGSLTCFTILTTQFLYISFPLHHD